MAFMTIVARKVSPCKRCGSDIAIGSKIRWSRRGGSYHMAADCPAGTAAGATTVNVDGALASAAAGPAVPVTAKPVTAWCDDAPMCGCCYV